MNSTGAQRKFSQSAYHSPETTVYRYGLALVGFDWDKNDRGDEEYKSGYDTEQGDAETKWKNQNQNTKPHSSTPVNRSR